MNVKGFYNSCNSWLMKNISLYKKSYYLKLDNHITSKIKIELDWSNHATKAG